ncbi:MAG TPA: Yip1 family protein [Sphingobium sp.]|uniref:Yip1 family protein n=1 Tax=Sphingobium sp. TaxID=1912891 RepID=UPI002ED48F0F
MTNEIEAAGRSLVTRAKAILLTPKTEWPVIATEPKTIREILIGYAIPLAAVGPVASFLGGQIFGYGMLGIRFRPSLLSGLSLAITSFVLTLVSLFVLTMIVEWLTPKFDGTASRVAAFKLVAYSMTASWLAGAFGLVPALAWLGIVGLYSFYLFYIGVTPILNVPAAKAVTFSVVTLLCAIGLWLVVGLVAGSVAAMFAAPALFSSNEGEVSGAVNVPGMGSIDVSKMQAAAQKAEAAASGATKTVEASALQAVLPGSVAGFNRTSIESQGLGQAGSNAEGRYEKNGQSFRLSVTDMSAMGALASMGAAMGVTSNRQDANGYEKTETVDNRIVTEKWNTTDKSGEYGTTLADRFMVKAEGQVDDIATLKQAVASIDAAKLGTLVK